MNHKLPAASAVLACVLTLPGAVCAATFVEIARFDVSASADASSASYIGNNPSAVAWNGRQLFIAGFNSSGAQANTAIAEITNAGATGVNAASLSEAFADLATPNLRGYSGLDLQGSVLVAAYDDGAADPNGIQALDASSRTQTWAKNARGGSGVAFDPGFGGADQGVAWTTFGSGRRALQDTATGADLYNTADGMIINTGSGSFWRDMDFDPATGDIYARRSNGVIMSTRTGGNSVTATSELVPVDTGADFVAGHMISFLAGTPDGDLLIYNDRPATVSGQPFASAVKLIDTSGTPEAATFSFIGGGTPADGNGYYDFDYDPATRTLAIADFANRNVHVFGVVPEPAACLVLVSGLLVGPACRFRGRH
ncbi:hypothetical protein Pla123a_11790 [Posidoniimonas polymericola]|uniref:PEP-CTERM protein-sorting domain-containing protein n=1 Tax=Posidoniimonas polymericola TaxID=2528002 RepID=A0A5C5YTV1_9BACT|nr:hypothetical protein [Posidoniimonas polymericola]TWT78388.1 hypothetical protein Pla123a_11790 [Posidoniimonas polymericola]